MFSFTYTPASLGLADAINYWVAYKACSWQYQLIYVAG